jgi:hypothetical protein
MASLPGWGLPYWRGTYGPLGTHDLRFCGTWRPWVRGNPCCVRVFVKRAPGIDRRGQLAGVIPVVAARYRRGAYGPATAPLCTFAGLRRFAIRSGDRNGLADRSGSTLKV